MQSYKNAFLQLATEVNALRFGEFTLKSGRVSPYFFNAGYFNTGKTLAKLAEFYAAAIVASGVRYDILFGPAYKGIPLVASIAAVLYKDHGIDKPFCYNRKEIKDHGEGGRLVGAALEGDVLLVDDVISAGTAIQQSAEIIAEANARFIGAAISLDRCEKGASDLSAVQEVEQKLNIKVINIANLDDLLSYLQNSGDAEHGDKIVAYRQQYGATL